MLSEDGAHDAVPSLIALTTRMFQVLEPTVRPDIVRKTFEPAEDRLQRALTANNWKSRSLKDQVQRMDLVLTIATHLLRPDGFVIFHFDGDTRYRDRASSQSVMQFARQIVAPLSQYLRKPREQPSKTEVEVDRVVQKLIQYVPYYCVESWMYYNLSVLESICRARVGARNDSILAVWRADPREIEEVEQPWRMVAAGKHHNRELAEQAYPTSVALDAGKSFSDTVTTLRGNQQLMSALQALT